MAQGRGPGGLVVGARGVVRAISAGAVRRVLVALDAPDAATGPVRAAAAARGIPVLGVLSAAELGRRCGISRPVAAVAEVSPHGTARQPAPQAVAGPSR